MKKSILIFITGLLVIGLLVGTASAMTGSGTSSDPYKIYNQSDLNLLSGSGYGSYAGTSKYFELANDIIMSGTFTPIGTSRYQFNGKFDGKGYKITGLKMSGGVPLGLFAYLSSGGVISNIDFYNADISSSDFGRGHGIVVGYCYSGTMSIKNINVYDSYVNCYGYTALCGCLYETESSITIENCNVERCFLGYQGDAGGILSSVSSASATITNCKVKDTIIYGNNNYIGGICGGGAYYNGNLTIRNCYVENCVLNGRYVGGITGQSHYSTGGRTTITNCHVLKSTIITSSYGYGGGIYGYADVTPTDSTLRLSECEVVDCSIIGNYVGGISAK